jgi:hypothetical protein
MAQFTFETVDGSGTVAGQCCLALDSRGNPRIAYAGAGGKLKVASRDSGSWSQEELFGGGFILPSVSDRVRLDIDSGGNPHIAYKERTSTQLFYGFKADNHWSFMPVPTRLERRDPGGITEFDFRLYFRRDTPELADTPHFVYHDPSTGQLGYTRRVGGSFKQVVAGAANTDISRNGLFPSIDFQFDSGSFLISFVEDFGDVESSLPSRTRVWLKQIIDPFAGTLGDAELLQEGNFNVVRPTSITAELSRTCVAFGDTTNQTLNVCFREGIAPGRAVVAPTVFPVVPSAAQTSRGQFRIAFVDENGLKLASRILNEWIVEVVDPEGGELPSLAYEKIPLNGHLAYTVRGTLKYAHWTEQP